MSFAAFASVLAVAPMLAAAGSEVKPLSRLPTYLHRNAKINKLHHKKATLKGHKDMNKVISLIAPESWKSAVFNVAATKAEHVHKEHDHRQLKKDKPDYYYRKNDNKPGYLQLKFYEDDATGDMCADGNMEAEMGFAVGTCFGAREQHGETVLGSFNIGIVEASSGRNHVHVEMYKSADCSGTAHRTENHLSRQHAFADEKLAVSSDHRSRHFWGDHDVTCYTIGYHEGKSAPVDDICMEDAEFFGHGEAEDCGDHEYTFYAAFSSQFDECDDGEYATCGTLTTGYNGIPAGSKVLATYFYLTQNDNMDPTCSSANIESDMMVMDMCRAFSGQGDDDDYGGPPAPSNDNYHDDDNYQVGWNNPKSPNFEPFDHIIFNEDNNGYSIEQSSLNLFNDCWSGRTSCMPKKGCYMSSSDSDAITGCSCHASCESCGYYSWPTADNDCITCADGEDVTPVYTDGTGTCDGDNSNDQEGAACPGCEASGSSFCNFDDGATGFCESCTGFDSSSDCNNDGLPTAGAASCIQYCIN
jgi:hypothetical protein